MPAFSVSKRIAASPQRTFDVFTDLKNADRHVAGIKRLEVLTDGPVRKGTRFRETRIMFKKEATETMEITDYQPGVSYTVGCESCGVVWSSTFRFSPDGDGTRVDLEMSCQAKGFFAKLMSPLSKLMAGSMLKCIESDLDDLKRVLETNA